MSAQRELAPVEAAPVEAAPDNVTPFPVRSNAPRVVTLDLDNAQHVEEMLIRFRNEFLVPGVDYGTIPHTNGATLYKPGGEKLLHFFGLGFKLEVTRDEDWKTGRVSYEVKTVVFDKRTRETVAEGLGNCNSGERKYKNKDAAEVANTCLKMAKKRSLLDGVLTATRSSGLFEDGDDVHDDRQNDRSRQNNQQRNNQQRNNQRQNNQQRQQAPVKPRAATRAELDRCERARQAAIALGYQTQSGTTPRPLASGTPVNEASAKCQRWEAFIRHAKVTPATNALEEAEKSIEADKRDPRYIIPRHLKGSPAKNCTSCGAQIYFIKAPDTGATVPVNVDGYSHFSTCPNASTHSKRPATPKPAVPATSGTNPLTNAQKRLWAVIGATGLPQAKDGEEKRERIEMCNQALQSKGYQPITSFNQLSDNEAAFLVEEIEAKRLAWGQGVPA